MRVTSPRQSRLGKPNFLAPNRFSHLRVDSPDTSVSRSRSTSSKRKLSDDDDSVISQSKKPAQGRMAPPPPRTATAPLMDIERVEQVEANLAKVASICETIPITIGKTDAERWILDILSDLSQAIRLLQENQVEIVASIKSAPASGVPFPPLQPSHVPWDFNMTSLGSIPKNYARAAKAPRPPPSLRVNSDNRPEKRAAGGEGSSGGYRRLPTSARPLPTIPRFWPEPLG